MKNFRLILLFCILATCVSCNKLPDPDPTADGKTYIIISDLHLGDSRSVNEGYGWNLQMKDTLSAFLDYLAKDDSWDELIVAGDLFEEWTTPADVAAMRDNNGTPVSEGEYFHKLITDNQAIFDKFRTLKESGRKLVYIPGNHDMLTTENDFEKYLCGVFTQARTEGVEGMGEYQPDENIFIEHGHRYDILNAPYKGKCGIDNIPSSSILPPGFFECKIYTSSKMEPDTKGMIQNTQKLDTLSYDILWDALGVMFGKEDVVTMIDGMTRTYAFDEYAGSEALLFKHIDKSDGNDGWESRCIRNKACIVPSVTTSILSGFVYDYCDEMGMDVLESDEMDASILVWGHSHAAKFISSGIGNHKVIYLNTGCWVDGAVAGAENTGTFGKIVRKESGIYDVSLCRFSITTGEKGAVTTLENGSITGNISLNN